jgi:hypothetical protein
MVVSVVVEKKEGVRERRGVRRSRQSVLKVRGRERCINVRKHSLTRVTPSGLFITYVAFT